MKSLEDKIQELREEAYRLGYHSTGFDLGRARDSLQEELAEVEDD